MSVSNKKLSANSNIPENQHSKISFWKGTYLRIQEIGNERFNKMDLIRAFMLGFMVTILLTNIIQFTGVDVSARLVNESYINKIDINVVECPISILETDAPFVDVINPIKSNPIEIIKAVVPSKKEESEQKEAIVEKQIVIESNNKKNALKQNTQPIKTSNQPKIVSTPPVQKVIKKKKLPAKVLKKPLVVKKIALNNSWATAQQKAISEGKGSFIIFGASWCAPCKIMVKSIQQNQNLQAYLKSNQVYQYIDIESNEGRLLNIEHQVYTLPSIVFFDKNGAVIRKEEGSLSSSKLLSILKGDDKKVTSSPVFIEEKTPNTNVAQTSEKETMLDSNQSVIINDLIGNIIERRAEGEK